MTVKFLQQSRLTSYWNPYAAIVLAGLLSAIYFGITGNVWAVTGEFTRLGGHILQLFGVDLTGWAYLQLVPMNGTTFSRTDGSCGECLSAA